MTDVFISYRRRDSSFAVDQIDGWLKAAFGQENIFVDEGGIELGADFPTRIEEALKHSKLLLLMIGPNWDSDRLRAETDWVRREIEIALNRDIKVIPVVLGNADLPKEDQLPKSLRAVPGLQAVRVRAGQEFTTNMRELVWRLAEVLGRAPRLINSSMTTWKNLDRWVREIADSVQDANENTWVFTFTGRHVICKCQQNDDLSIDRMRVMAPVAEVSALGDRKAEFYERMLEANFHKALDPRYCLSDSLIWAAFLHELSTLTEHQFKLAVKQVVALVTTFGSGFASSHLVLGKQGR